MGKKTPATAVPFAVALNADGTAPDWIHILPAGPTVAGRDGREWTLQDAELVVRASIAEGEDLLVDTDHSADLAGPTKAAGWIKDLQARPDGIWARVEWTESGRQAVAGREYRFVSPVFYYAENDDRKEILRIGGVSLTNKPNLSLKALNHEETMDETFKALCEALGLDPENTEQQTAIDAVKALKDTADGNAAKVKAVCQKLDLGEDAGQDDIVKAIASQAQAGTGAGQGDGGAEPDPTKYVPMETHKALQSRVVELENSLTEDKATAAVDEAIKEGRLIPAQRDWALNYARKDLAGFQEFVGQQPKILASGRVAPEPGEGQKDTLSPEEKALCARMGITEDKFLETKKAREAKEQEAA